QAVQEIRAALLTLVGVDAQVYPARGAVDGHKQITMGSLVGHLWRALNIHVDKNQGVVFQRLGRNRCVFVLDRAPIQAVTCQTPQQTGGLRNSRNTTNRSSSGNQRVRRTSIATASWVAVSMPC